MTETIHKLPRMRGIQQAIDELKELDPETALTKTALRRLILTKQIPSVRAGRKYLINMDALSDFLYNGSGSIAPVAEYNGIRMIKE